MTEEKKAKAARKYRGKAAIVKLLQEQIRSRQNIKSFRAGHGIAEGTFHNWKQRYREEEIPASNSFATSHAPKNAGL